MLPENAQQRYIRGGGPSFTRLERSPYYDIPPCSEGEIVLFTSFVSREIFLQMEFAVRMTCSTCEEDVGKALRGVGGR